MFMCGDQQQNGEYAHPPPLSRSGLVFHQQHDLLTIIAQFEIGAPLLAHTLTNDHRVAETSLESDNRAALERAVPFGIPRAANWPIIFDMDAKIVISRQMQPK